jgi:hypothetical protein
LEESRNPVKERPYEVLYNGNKGEKAITMLVTDLDGVAGTKSGRAKG